MSDLPLLIVVHRELQTLTKAVEQLNRTKKSQLSEEFVKKAEVLKTLGISNRTLYKLTSTGVLSYVKLGGLLFFKVSDIEKILNENYVSDTTKGNHTPLKRKKDE